MFSPPVTTPAITSYATPSLVTSVEDLREISLMVKVAKFNRQQCILLENRCTRLLELLHNNIQSMETTQIGSTADRVAEVLRGVKTSMATWQSPNCVLNFGNRAAISREIELKFRDIDECIGLFMLSNQMVMSEWVQELKAAQQHDSDTLQALYQGQVETNNTLQAVSDGMRELQIQLRGLERGTPAHTATQQQLFSTQKQWDLNLPIHILDKNECQKIGAAPVAGSSMYDIFKGLYLGEEIVALKNLRGVLVNDDEMEKASRRFQRQAEIWSKLRHKHVHQLYGVTMIDGSSPSLVSPWLKNGDAPNYISRNPSTDRIKICLEVAYGLQYLHTLPEPIIHGGLQGSNVLIGDDGTAMLSDFGLSKVLESQFTQSNGPVSSCRWMAPEIQEGEFTVAVDIWSWAMTSLELLSGKYPFCKIKLPGRVLIVVSKGQLPERAEYEPPHIDDRIWALFRQCWKLDPAERPDIHYVVGQMEQIHASLQ